MSSFPIESIYISIDIFLEYETLNMLFFKDKLIILDTTVNTALNFTLG